MATISLKNTKNVIYKGYQEAIAEARKLKTQLSTAERNLSKLEETHKRTVSKLVTADGKLKTAPRSTTKVETIVKVVEKVASVNTVKGIIEVLSSIEEGIGTAISQCSGMQVIEAEKLGELQEQISEHKTQLKSLYDIELADGALDTLLETYEKEQETFDKNLEEEKATYEADLEEKQKTWAKEQEEKTVMQQDLKEEDQKEQQREKTEYKYKLQLERDIEHDNYAQKLKKLQDELTDIKETKQDEFKLKEKTVKEKEVEFSDYKKKHGELPEKLKKAIRAAEYEGTAIIERDAKVKMNLYKKEVESTQKANELRIKSLRDLLVKQETQIAKLSNQLENALQQAQNLAIKAIEGTAHAESFSAIKALAMEQAKHVHKSK